MPNGIGGAERAAFEALRTGTSVGDAMTLGYLEERIASGALRPTEVPAFVKAKFPSGPQLIGAVPGPGMLLGLAAGLAGGGLISDVLAGAGAGVALTGGAPVIAATGVDVALAERAGAVNGIVVGGPGVPEPPAGSYSKYWKTMAYAGGVAGAFWTHFWKMNDGRILMFNPNKTEWKIWKPKKMIVISPDPKLSSLRKLSRVVRRTSRTMSRLGKDFMPKPGRRVTIGAPTQYLSPVERRAVKAGR